MPKLSRELTELFRVIDHELFEWGPYGVLYVKGTTTKVSDVLRGQDTCLGKRREEKVRRALAAFLDRPLEKRRKGEKRPLYVVDWGEVRDIIEERSPKEVWVGLEGKWNEKTFLVYRAGEYLRPRKFSLGSTRRNVEGLADGYLFPCGVKGNSPTKVWRT